MNEPRRVLLVWPYLPAYNVEFVRRSRHRLALQGHELILLTGSQGLQRGDEADVEGRRLLRERAARLGGRTLLLRHLPPVRSSDLLIVEQAVKNLETYPLLLRRPDRSPGVAMMGHGRSYSVAQSPVLASFKQWLTRRGDWFFAYTVEGADHVISRGFPRSRVTVVHNTIDTDQLAHDLSAVSDEELAHFCAEHRLTRGRTVLFLGGVDRRKGIRFLLESARYASAQLAGFTLLIGGSGVALDEARARERAGDPVRVLGRLDGHGKAVALAASEALAIPEWIGLVAVDSLVAGRPIVATRHPSHSSEVAYLQPGRTGLFADHDPVAYAHCLTGLLMDPARLSAMQRACRAASVEHGLDLMVDSFVGGVVSWSRQAAPGGARRQ